MKPSTAHPLAARDECQDPAQQGQAVAALVGGVEAAGIAQEAEAAGPGGGQAQDGVPPRPVVGRGGGARGGQGPRDARVRLVLQPE